MRRAYSTPPIGMVRQQRPTPRSIRSAARGARPNPARYCSALCDNTFELQVFEKHAVEFGAAPARADTSPSILRRIVP
jgi:hypothetical protein